MIKLPGKKRQIFKLILEDEGLYKKGDILMHTPTQEKVLVIREPKKQYWQRLKKWLGLNYKLYFKCKIL